MKSKFIIKNAHKKLVAVFSGWAINPEFYSDFKTQNSDLIIFYDYQNLEINQNIFTDYEKIDIIAWSLGVWIATIFFTFSVAANSDFIIKKKLIELLLLMARLSQLTTIKEYRKKYF